MSYRQVAVSILLAVQVVGCRAHQSPLIAFNSPPQSKVVVKNELVDSDDADNITYIHRGGNLLFRSGIKDSLNESHCFANKKLELEVSPQLGPLSQFKYQGYLASGGVTKALIVLPSGELVMLGVASTLGQQVGRITQITPQYLLVQQEAEQSSGCYVSRQVKLVASGRKGKSE
ncbi:pilus assembly protein PilP [Vibrio profundum]|uniref:pilus assembly protein PilP n=1 Tax=Vibrio profundum TaxID=2910247 RepID=UPI003D1231FD